MNMAGSNVAPDATVSSPDGINAKNLRQQVAHTKSCSY